MPLHNKGAEDDENEDGEMDFWQINIPNDVGKKYVFVSRFGTLFPDTASPVYVNQSTQFFFQLHKLGLVFSLTGFS